MNDMFSTGRNWSRKSIEDIFDSLFTEGSGSDGDGKYDVDNVWVPCCDSLMSQMRLIPFRLYKRDTGEYNYNRFRPMGSAGSFSGSRRYWLMIAESSLLQKDGEVFTTQNFFSNDADINTTTKISNRGVKNLIMNRVFELYNSSDLTIKYNHKDVTSEENYNITDHPCRMFIYYNGNGNGDSHSKGWYEIINKHYGGSSNVTILHGIEVVEEQVYHKRIRSIIRNQAEEQAWKPFTQCILDVLEHYFGVAKSTAENNFRTLVPVFAFGTTGALKSDIEPEYVTLKCPECDKEFNVKPDPYEPPEPGQEPEPQIFYCPYCGAEVEYFPPAPPEEDEEEGEGENENTDDKYHFFKPFDIVEKIETKGEEEEQEEDPCAP